MWYPTVSDLNNNTFKLEDTVNTKRNWTQVTVIVVLALASLSSTTAVAAMSAAPDIDLEANRAELMVSGVIVAIGGDAK